MCIVRLFLNRLHFHVPPHSPPRPHIKLSLHSVATEVRSNWEIFPLYAESTFGKLK